MDRPVQHPLLALIHRRVSADRFDPGRPIDPETIRDLVLDATRAPSSFNMQHWRFVAVCDPAGKKRLQAAAYNQEQVSAAGVTFIVLGDTRAEERLAEILDVAVVRGALAAGKAAAWLRMAHTIYADPQLARDEAVRSASLAAMLLILSAEARGLAAGALSGFDPQRVAEEFGIPARFVPVMLVAVGHALPTSLAPMPRLGVDEVLCFDRFRLQ